MHNSLKILVSAFILITICGCSDGGKLKYDIKTIHRETEEYSINGEIIELEGDSGGTADFNAQISNEADGWSEDFITRVMDVTNKSDVLPKLQFRNVVKYNKNGVFSVISEKYTYITGLHGNSWQTAITFDSESDRILSLSDLFVDDKFYGILNERIDEMINENAEEYRDLWEKPVVDKKREDKFYLEGDNLVIFYEPYELSYYARGVVEFPIPMEEIRGYVKENYLTPDK